MSFLFIISEISHEFFMFIALYIGIYESVNISKYSIWLIWNPYENATHIYKFLHFSCKCSDIFIPNHKPKYFSTYLLEFKCYMHIDI